MLEFFHQLWAPRFCQSALGSHSLPFFRLRWLQSVQVQLPAGKATATASTEPVPLSWIKESLLDRSATNDNQGCFDACESMIKKDGRQYLEEGKIKMSVSVRRCPVSVSVSVSVCTVNSTIHTYYEYSNNCKLFRILTSVSVKHARSTKRHEGIGFLRV